MKKIILIVLALLLTALGLDLVSVQAYSPHYLPGGKNYLSPSNFTENGGFYQADSPFLVKPYTNYCLAIPRAYYDFAFGEILFSFYENETVLSTLALTPADFLWATTPVNYYFYTFQTSAMTNYLAISFEEAYTYLNDFGVSEMQLEEGIVPTAIEAFIEGELIDTNGPYFSGTGIIISNVDDPTTLSEIQSGIYAYDAVSLNVTSGISVVSDGFTGNGGILGNYAIVFRAADAAGNTTDFHVTVKVVDVTVPIFSGPGTVVVPYPATYTLEQLKAMVHASDNYDGDITSSITTTNDAYSASSGIVGNHEVTYQVSDASGNTAIYSIVVSVVDEQAPVFSGISEATIGYDQTLTVESIRASLSALDDYDDDVTGDIVVKSDGYSAHLHEIGQYVIVFEVTDSNGNTAEKTVLIRVVDEIGPIIYFDTSIIRIYNSTVLSLTDFTTLLVRAGELKESVEYAVSVRFDSYSSHASTPGVYHLSLDFEAPDGSRTTKTFQVVVKDVSEKPMIIVPDPVIEGNTNFLVTWQTWIVGGILFVITAASNLVWIIITRKKLRK